MQISGRRVSLGLFKEEQESDCGWSSVSKGGNGERRWGEELGVYSE